MDIEFHFDKRFLILVSFKGCFGVVSAAFARRSLHQSLRALTGAVVVSMGVFIDDKRGCSSKLHFAHIDLWLGYWVLASTRHMSTDLA